VKPLLRRRTGAAAGKRLHLNAGARADAPKHAGPCFKGATGYAFKLEQAMVKAEREARASNGES
jgi:hypothetical protein